MTLDIKLGQSYHKERKALYIKRRTRDEKEKNSSIFSGPDDLRLGSPGSSGNSGVLVAEAHSGRTDRYGGHRDNKNKSGLGSYHYHCGGHPAHLHENGVCPYASYVEEVAPAASPEETAAEAPENLYMVFDPIYYADHNPDLYEAFGYDTDQLQEHFLTCGMKEGRPGCADFNVAVYKEQNADLAVAYGDDLAAYYTHYMGCGHGEGRVCH